MSFRSAVKKLIPKKLFGKIELYGHLLEAVIFNIIYGFPARKKTGLMTTVGYGVGKNVKPQMVHMTTQTVPVLMKRLKYMREQGVDGIVTTRLNP